MQVTVMANPRAPHQVQAAEALCDGLRAAGHEARYTTSRRATTRLVACWGWRKGQELRHRGHDVLVMERGYLGDREVWHSLGWNGLNGRATFNESMADPERFRFHHGHRAQPWKDGGDYVLLIGQVPGDMSLAGKDLRKWYADTASEAREHYGLPVVFRQHPVALERGLFMEVPGVEQDAGDLGSALESAAVVVTWNSNTAVDAVLAGVPAITYDRGSVAWEVTGHAIGAEQKPDREDWLARLAWKQWTLAEMASGEAADCIMEVCPC